MAENVENLILEQLRALRGDMADMGERLTSLESRVSEGFETVEVGQRALQGVLMGLGHSIYNLDSRVEHIEEKLGIEQ